MGYQNAIRMVVDFPTALLEDRGHFEISDLQSTVFCS